MSRKLLILLALLGCDEEGRGPGRPPPARFPWLADTYAVEVELRSNQCNPGGFEPVALPATAVVWQDGTRVEWQQGTEADDGEFWYLQGALCARGDGHVLRLAGGRRNTVSGCQVRLNMPPEPVAPTADPCTTEGFLEFEFDEDGCGGLHMATETVTARLTYQRTCEWRSNCDMEFMLRAVPVARDGRAPAVPAECL